MSASPTRTPGSGDPGGVVGLFAWGLRLAASLLLLAMMIVTFVDVVGRYVFNAPLAGAYELTEVLLALVVFIGLPIVTFRREHVTVDLVTSRLPFLVRRGLAVLAGVVMLLVLAVLAWRLGLLAIDFTEYGDTTVNLKIPLGPVAAVMAVLAALSALAALLALLRR